MNLPIPVPPASSHDSSVGTGIGNVTRSSAHSSNDLHLPLTSDLLGLMIQWTRQDDRTLSVCEISPGWQAFFDLEASLETIDPTCILRWLDPTDVTKLYGAVERSSQTQQPWRWQGQFKLPSGKSKWVQCDATPQVQPDSSLRWVGLMIDITSQQKLNAEVERLSFLLGLTERLESSTDLREISRFALDYLVQATRCAFGDVKVIRRDTDTPQAFPLVNHVSGEFVATYGQPVAIEMEAVLRQGQPQGQGLLWKVVSTGQALFVEDYANHPDSIPALRHPGIGQIAVFPIPATDGAIIGVLTLEARNLQWIRDLPQQDLILAACRILGVRIEQAQAQERLQQQTQRLEHMIRELQRAQMQLVQSEKMSSLGQLVAGVAHEINNPVSFIQGNLPYAENYIEDLLTVLDLYQQHYPQPQPELQAAIENLELPFIRQDLPKLLNSMKIGSQRIRDIVLSLRNFSRLDEAEMKPVDIHEGIDNSIMILEHRLKAQPHRPEIQIEKNYANLPPVECYAGQLNQVFMNLLVNAIDALDEAASCEVSNHHPCHNPDHKLENSDLEDSHPENSDFINSRVPKIYIKTEQVEPNQVLIRIGDNGPGIPEEVQSRLFDPFFTTKPIGKGTGMGLSISYQIVTEKHGGSLWCHSQPDRGAEFVIQIPIQATAFATL